MSSLQRKIDGIITVPKIPIRDLIPRYWSGRKTSFSARPEAEGLKASTANCDRISDISHHSTAGTARKS